MSQHNKLITNDNYFEFIDELDKYLHEGATLVPGSLQQFNNYESGGLRIVPHYMAVVYHPTKFIE